MIKVKATAKGFYGSRVRREGEEFEIESRAYLGSWMEVLEGDDKPARGRPKKSKDDAQEADAQDQAE